MLDPAKILAFVPHRHQKSGQELGRLAASAAKLLDDRGTNVSDRAVSLFQINRTEAEWWERQDSNLRRHSQRIYSPPPLPLGTLSPEAVAPY